MKLMILRRTFNLTYILCELYLFLLTLPHLTKLSLQGFSTLRLPIVI